MLTTFAGPIFTEWYWGIFYYIIVTSLFVILLAALALLAAKLIYKAKNKDLPNNTSKAILLTIFILWAVGYFVFDSYFLR